MKRIKNLFVLILLVLCFGSKAWADSVWINDLRSLFLGNNSVIYAINIRTFNANDKNKNGIIEEELGEDKGSFINAIDRLDELVMYGVNTIHVLPITSVGKTKALGTAGSLYSASSFSEINPQLKDKNSKLSLEEEARLFIDECHKRKLRVMIDLPSCGSYDLFLTHPELYIKDKDQNPVVPADWTDVRLLNAGTNAKINQDVYKLYKDFVRLVVDLDADGIRADVATIKPHAFWQKLISETKHRNPEFLFLAEASDSWKKSPSEYAVFTTYDKLLDAGFDGYYGSYFNLKNWKKSNELYSTVKFNIDLATKYPEKKSVIGSFSTHDEVSPVMINGTAFSKMIIWLNSTLPLNPYYIDGFPTGDDYIYPLANKKAKKSSTDDEYYFVHRGQLDIFNSSRKPAGPHYDILGDFVRANSFRRMSKDIIANGTFTPLRTSSESVFAYVRALDKKSIVVIGNLDFKKTQTVKIYVPKLTTKMASIPIKISNIPILTKGKITTELNPGEIQVIYFNEIESK